MENFWPLLGLSFAAAIFTIWTIAEERAPDDGSWRRWFVGVLPLPVFGVLIYGFMHEWAWVFMFVPIWLGNVGAIALAAGIAGWRDPRRAEPPSRRER